MKDMDTETDICSFFEKKLELFNQYLSITKELKETLEAKKVGLLEGLLSRRQDCIKGIEGIDLTIEKMAKAASSTLSHISEKSRALISGYLIDLKNIMETVDHLDRELVNKVKEEGQGIKKELLEMHNARVAAKGYKGEMRYAPRFLSAMR